MGIQKEHHLPELLTWTQKALDAAQRLKQDSIKLRADIPRSYGDLISRLSGFVQSHVVEIDILHSYVKWLSARDPLAPCILFTYRVWGSTRLFVRRPVQGYVSPAAIPREMLVETVLGLYSNDNYMLASVRRETLKEAWESGDSSLERAASSPHAPTTYLVTRTSYEAFDACTEYFEMVRDSLRNIILEIEEFNQQRRLLTSESFWRKVVLKVKDLRRTETSLWDFKEILDMWKIRGGSEKDKAELKFAETVASFANRNGGVIIVGVTNEPPRRIEGVGELSDLESRLKYTADVVRKYLKCPPELVSFQQVELSNDAGASKICLVIVVAGV